MKRGMCFIREVNTLSFLLAALQAITSSQKKKGKAW